MSLKAVKRDLVQAYGSTFTAEELHRLAGLYCSDMSQLLLRKQPGAARLVSAARQGRALGFGARDAVPDENQIGVT